MSKQKYTPLDSEQDPVKAGQAVTKKKSEMDDGELGALKDPAKKRKFSEQPPSRRNTKT